MFVHFKDSDITVKEILSKSPFGQNLFDKYEKSNHITPNQQTDLVHHIVDYYIRTNMSITIESCKEIAEELVQLFPTESLVCLLFILIYDHYFLNLKYFFI